MLNKIIPHTLFGILMTVIASLFIFYLIITGSLSIKDVKSQQKALMATQVEQALNAKPNPPVLTQPEHAELASVEKNKLLRAANKSVSKQYYLYQDTQDPKQYWLYDHYDGWISFTMQPSSYFWFSYFGPKIILMLLLIAICALVLSRMIKKPLVELTTSLLLFKNKHEIAELNPQGPKEFQAVFIAVKQMMTDINTFEQQRQWVLAGIAHDICTPLARIRVALEMLPLDAQKKQALISDIDQINYLQEQFLRYTSAKQTQQIQTVDLAGLLENCAEHYPPQTVLLNLPTEPICIKANSGQLQRAFDNILANALQYGAAPIMIEMKMLNQEIMIQITDSGKGVPEELLPKISQPLFRTDNARSNCQGTGLGLAIFTEVIQALGGRVVFANAKPLGLQVTVYLPV